MNTRRHFLKVAGTGILAAGTAKVFGAEAYPLPPKKYPVTDTFSVGMAGYTFLRFDIDKTIQIMKKVGVNYLSLKDFHMPLNSNQEQITGVIEKFKSAGIAVYTVGVIYMKTRESVDQAFEYAKMAGVKMIVGAQN